jgi:serine/threonine protein kinase
LQLAELSCCLSLITKLLKIYKMSDNDQVFPPYDSGFSSPSLLPKIPHDEAKKRLLALKDGISQRTIDIDEHLVLLTDAIVDSRLHDDAYSCIRLLISVSDEVPILKLLNHLNKELAKCNSEDKENFLRAFQKILDELQNKDEDIIVKVVNSFIPSLLNNVKAETAEVIASILSLHTRFVSIHKLRNRVVMFHIGGYFCTGEMLGKGTFGHVYKGFHKETGNIVAIKAIKYVDKSTHHQRALRREIEMMKYMNHPNIIRLYDAVKDDRYLYLMLEYSCIGDLEKYIKTKTDGRLTQEEAHHFMKEIANALKFLRSRKIVHRDLKTENFLVFNEEDGTLRLKLSDFTSARQLHENQMTRSLWGTPLYMAPEILDNKKYTDKADLWSVGVIMYRLMFNKLPYTGENWSDLAANIRNNPVKFPSDCAISEEAKNLLLGLLNRDPFQRIGWDKFFTHQYFSSTSPKVESSKSSTPDDNHSIEYLEAQVKKFKEAFLTSQQQLYILENRLNEAYEREAKLEQNYQEALHREEKLRQENENLLRKIREMELEKVTAPNSSQETTQNSAASKDQINVDKLSSELENCKKENVSLVNKIQNLELENKELNKLILDTKNKYEIQISALTKHNEELAKQLAETSMHCDTLVNLFKKDVRDIEVEKEKIIKEKKKLEEELKSYKIKDAEMQSLQAIVLKQTKEKDELQLKLQTLTKAIEVYQENEAQSKEQYTQLMNEYSKTVEQLQLSEETVALLREELKKAEEDLAALQQENSLIRAKLN